MLGWSMLPASGTPVPGSNENKTFPHLQAKLLTLGDRAGRRLTRPTR
jgi:hypothetical protein